MVRLNGMKNDGRCPGVTILCKAIRNGLHQRPAGLVIGIDIHFTKLTERPQIVDATTMVVMDMSEQDGIYLPKRLTEHLLAEIRARINQDTCTFGFYQCRTTQPLIVRVCTPTSPAGATNSGHAYRCSRSQKSQLHMLNDIHLWLDFDAKAIVDIHPDLFTKMHNLVTRSTTLVNQYQSLTVVHTGASECLSFPTTLVNHPPGRNLLMFLVDSVMRHVGIQSSEPFIFLTGHYRIHEETTCISFELGIRQFGIADIDNNLT